MLDQKVSRRHSRPGSYNRAGSISGNAPVHFAFREFSRDKINFPERSGLPYLIPASMARRGEVTNNIVFVSLSIIRLQGF